MCTMPSKDMDEFIQQVEKTEYDNNNWKITTQQDGKDFSTDLADLVNLPAYDKEMSIDLP